MDDDFGSNPETNQETNSQPVATENSTGTRQNEEKINKYEMDDKGRIHTQNGGAAAVSTSSRTFVILGWISAALTLLLSPYFAIAGIVFGILANKRLRSSGNVIIIVNAALAVISLLFNVILMWR